MLPLAPIWPTHIAEGKELGQAFTVNVAENRRFALLVLGPWHSPVRMEGCLRQMLLLRRGNLLRRGTFHPLLRRGTFHRGTFDSAAAPASSHASSTVQCKEFGHKFYGVSQRWVSSVPAPHRTATRGTEEIVGGAPFQQQGCWLESWRGFALQICRVHRWY